MPLPSHSSRLGSIFGLVLMAACSNRADAPPPSCRSLTFDGAPYAVCSFEPAKVRFRLAHTAPDGAIFGQFDRLAAHLADNKDTLVFAMNAGMYHDDRRPVGLYVENGKETAPIQIGPSPGNFGMVPNGVFVITRSDNDETPKTVAVMKSEDYVAANIHPSVEFATQSGPMLVIDGKLHPKFNANGPSKKKRNGVGVSANGTVHFAVSEVPVNFHSFARLFRDELATPNALFLDGQVSKLFAAELGRNDQGLDMGPIIAVIE